MKAYDQGSIGFDQEHGSESGGEAGGAAVCADDYGTKAVKPAGLEAGGRALCAAAF